MIVNEAVVAAFLVAAFASAIPLLLAAMGETVGEQSGVLNIGQEGMLLFGAYFAYVTTLATGSFWLGFLGGAVAGMVLAAVMVVLSVWLSANQIVVGIGLLLAGSGMTSMLFDWFYADAAPRVGSSDVWRLPLLSELPIVGAAVFSQHGMLYLTFGIAWMTSIWLYRTGSGLRLRSAGQSPASLDVVGGSVRRVRSIAVWFSGALSGLGGAYLALISAGTFTPAMTHGLGFLAIVVAMLSRGKLLWVVLVALAYGLFIATGTALQLGGSGLSTELITILPFVAVLAALVLFARNGSALPPALATAYVRGER